MMCKHPTWALEYEYTNGEVTCSLCGAVVDKPEKKEDE
jgi:transcription initiation factor TFIIIB Brf1 subunit/transcription initiation factor TFIIB